MLSKIKIKTLKNICMDCSSISYQEKAKTKTENIKNDKGGAIERVRKI